MRAYFDESGIHDDAEICAIAGYFGHEKSWTIFERRWLAILKEFGVPEYHARRFWARDGSGDRVGMYAGWSNLKARRFYNRLLEAIVRCRIYPVGAAVVRKEWESLSQNERRYLTGGQLKNGRFITSGAPKKKYFLPFLQVVSHVANYCQRGETADFFFGLDRSFSGYALNYYRQIQGLKRPYSLHMGAIGFPRSIRTPPLQAADLLSYEAYRYSLKRLRHGQVPLRPKSDLNLALSRLKDVNDFKLFDKKGVDVVLASFRKEHADLCSN